MVKWTTPAKQDLKQIYDYIAKDSKFYAQKVSQDIVDKSEILRFFPEIGRIVPEMRNSNIRELIIYSYRLIYEVHPTSIQILALIHTKRDFSHGDLNELRSKPRNSL